MEAQQIFDTVVAHLRQQGRKASGKVIGGMPTDATCLYRTDDGLKCAVGCLISYAEYSPNMENVGTVATLLAWIYCPLSLRERLHPHLDLLCRLQSVHDNHRVEDWEEQLGYVAETFDLTYTPPEK